ncbi:MAG: hypothetical protein HY929_07580 [Euryarchaeota archaeon]|nr:hypothetical protein [Euryarchaeota archaeon]
MKHEIVCPCCKRGLTLEIKVDSKVKSIKIIGDYEIIKSKGKPEKYDKETMVYK